MADTLDYITITRKEYMDLVSNNLNYGHLLNVLYQDAEFNPYRDGLEYNHTAINHILCALDTRRYFHIRNMKEQEANAEIERIKNEYGIDKDNRQ